MLDTESAVGPASIDHLHLPNCSVLTSIKVQFQEIHWWLLNFYVQSTVLGTLEWKDNRTKYLALRKVQFIMRLDEYTKS